MPTITAFNSNLNPSAFDPAAGTTVQSATSTSTGTSVPITPTATTGGGRTAIGMGMAVSPGFSPSSIGGLQNYFDLYQLQNSGRIYTGFKPETDIQSNVKQEVTEAVWSDGTGSLKIFFTSSVQSGSNGDYYFDVYNLNPALNPDTAEVQFAIAYGDRMGSGSAEINAQANDTSLTPSKAIYSQYRSLLLAATDEQFTLANGSGSDSIIVINFNRARVKEKIDVGNWELCLSSSLGMFKFIDDSTITTSTTIGNGGAVYNIVSGSYSMTTPVYNSTAPVYYGKAYPDYGILVFDALAVSGSTGLGILRTSNMDCNNHGIFLTAMSASAAASDADNDFGFQCRNSQTITSTYYFVRVLNGEYNFSNNPSFTSGSLGEFRHSEMINNPSVYITTVGLYNDRNELLAVAKMSKPLLKNFNTEASLRIKLDF